MRPASPDAGSTPEAALTQGFAREGQPRRTTCEGSVTSSFIPASAGLALVRTTSSVLSSAASWLGLVRLVVVTCRRRPPSAPTNLARASARWVLAVVADRSGQLWCQGPELSSAADRQVRRHPGYRP